MNDTKALTAKKALFGLQSHMGLLIAFFVLIAGLLLAVIGYRMVIETKALSIKEQIIDTTTIVRNEVIDKVRQPVRPTIDTLSQGLLSGYRTHEERMSYLPILTSMLDNRPIIACIYVGYGNGDFFMVHKMDSVTMRNSLNIPPQTAFLVMSIVRSGAEIKERNLLFDSDLQPVAWQGRPLSTQYDPRVRAWYQEAMKTSEQVETAPYLTPTTGEPITTFAQRSPDGRCVIGADILLADLSKLLERELPTPNARLALLRSDGTLIAKIGGITHEDDNKFRLLTVDDLSPVLRLAAQAYLAGQRGRGIDFNDGDQDWEVSLEEFDYKGEAKNAMLLAIPRNDLLSGGMRFLHYALVSMAGILIFCTPFIWLFSRRISDPLHSLSAQAANLHGCVCSEENEVRSNVSEINDLAGNIRWLQGSIRNMLTITRAISSEPDFNYLLERVLQETLSVTKADGGAVTLLDDEKKIILDHGSVCWKTGGEHQTTCLEWAFSDDANKPDMTLSTYQSLAQDMVMQTSIARDDPRSSLKHLAPGFADPQVNRLDAVCVPLRDRMSEHIGALVLFKSVKDERSGFQFKDVSFIEAFAATAAIALENQRLLKGQNELRDALIHIIAGAIDAKSPYTGGHCQRVPVIFQMLLEAACEAKEGPFKDFTLDENGWEEAKLAGWLHDCGKVTTPEYVMDKATKLETLYDRIHEIRTRFEVLKRDAEIAFLRAVLGGADEEAERRKLEKELRALDDDFAFVAQCNEGSEHMSDNALARLIAIGGRTWVRTLDKRLGVSQGEKQRMERTEKPTLPVREKLLINAPEHIIERGEKDMLDPLNPWGFILDTPEALYNRGELHNLSIRRGTLTEEERYKINDHITRTIIMLEAMPLPKHLRGVPELAGAHHETMDGQGYPRRLTREGMSWGARMMAVADIFEALTAWDRPYKSSKTLRESLDIMEGFKSGNRIDPDVYELFLRSGVPQRYAKEYLKPEQNDL